MSYDVFLSYPSPQRAQADTLAYLLRAAGYRVFVDGDALIGGANWRQALKHHVTASPHFIALFCTHTASAHYQISEISWAVRGLRTDGHPKQVIPVRLDDADAPMDLEPLHIVDARGGDFTGVLAALRGQPAPPRRARAPAPAPAPTNTVHGGNVQIGDHNTQHIHRAPSSEGD